VRHAGRRGRAGRREPAHVTDEVPQRAQMQAWLRAMSDGPESAVDVAVRTEGEAK